MSINLENPTPKILIVEDQVLIAHKLKAALESLGYKVIGIEMTAEKGIALCEKDPPDLVLMDIILEGQVDGIEAAEVIRSRWGIPIIFLAAFADKERLKRAKPAYPFGYLIKPFRDQDLKITVEMALYVSKVDAERKKAEEALRFSEEKFSKIFRTSPDAIAIARSSDGVYMEVNEGYTKVTGYSKEELIGRSPLPGDLNLWVRREDRDPFAAALKETGEALGREIQFRHKNGTIRNALLSARVLDMKGETCHVAIISDITERKRMEEELSRSEEKFRTIFENNSAATALIESDSTFSMVNDAYCRMTGFTKQEVVGTSWTQIIPPEDLGRMKEYNRRRRINPQDAPTGYEFTFYRKKGEIRHGLISAAMIPSNQQLIVSVIDITELKQAEEALRQSEERHRIIIQTAMDGFWMIDIHGRLLEVNETYCRMSGYSYQELLAMNIADLDANETKKEITAHIQQVRLQRETRFETRHRRKDGSIFDVEVSPKYRPTYGGGFEVFLRDITDRKQAEMALKESKDRLRALSAHLQSVREEERSNISREIHDDLGQLLTGLKMDLSWILRHPNPNQSELKEKAQAMGQLIDQTVQTVRRISTELRPRILDDFGLVAALEWQAEEFAKKTGITCLFRTTGGALDLKPDLSIAVFRIFQEALTNVARHSRATKVEASIKKDAKGLVLMVRDNGQGIPEEEVVRSKSLGLVGMRERALILGGTVEIKGKKGKGTTVILRLPISQ